MAVGLRELCTLLMGGALGVGGTMTVQKAATPKPAIERKAKPRVARPVQARPAQVPSASLLSDCPMPSALIGPLAGIAPLAPNPVWSAFPPVVDHPWDGGWIYPPIQPPINLPAIPEPAAWATMIVGFGLVGMSARKARKTA